MLPRDEVVLGAGEVAVAAEWEEPVGRKKSKDYYSQSNSLLEISFQVKIQLLIIQLIRIGLLFY